MSVYDPCVVRNGDGALTGFDVELMREIARELQVPITFHDVGPFARVFDGVRSGEAAFAIAGITITAEREGSVDFSHHYLDSGLQVLVRDDGSGSSGWSIAKAFFGSRILWLFIALLVIVAHGLWLVERRHGQIASSYLRGVSDALYWAVVTCSTVGYGDIAPKGVVGRWLTIGLILSGVATFGMVSADVVSQLTVQRIASDIQGPDDLRGKQVATVHGSTSEQVLEQRFGARVTAFDTVEEAYRALDAAEVQAVVYDAPALLRYAHTAGRGRVAVVGPMFERQYYGIAMPVGSGYREAVNRALLKLRGNGTYDRLYREWIGG